MRRRLDIELEDSTTKPYLSLDEFDGKLYLQPADSVLYDEALWAELTEARERLRDVERRVLDALVREPLDSVEIELGRKQYRMVSDVVPHDPVEWGRIEAALRDHAAKVEKS